MPNVPCLEGLRVKTDKCPDVNMSHHELVLYVTRAGLRDSGVWALQRQFTFNVVLKAFMSYLDLIRKGDGASAARVQLHRVGERCEGAPACFCHLLQFPACSCPFKPPPALLLPALGQGHCSVNQVSDRRWPKGRNVLISERTGCAVGNVNGGLQLFLEPDQLRSALSLGWDGICFGFSKWETPCKKKH